MEGDAIPSQTTVRGRVRGRGNRWVGEILLKIGTQGIGEDRRDGTPGGGGSAKGRDKE